MPAFVSPFPATTVFELSAHAELRVFERTGVSGGQLLSYLQQGLCVWLDEVGADGTRYALLHSPAVHGFYVAAVSANAVLKTVLTLQMYELSRSPLPPIWCVLLRMQMAQRLAPVVDTTLSVDSPEERAPHAATGRRRSRAVVQPPPAGGEFALGWQCRLDLRGTGEVRDLGTMDTAWLTELGVAHPQGNVTLRTCLRWTPNLAGAARQLLALESIRQWLLDRLAQHAEVVQRVVSIEVCAMAGTHRAMHFNATKLVGAALELWPAEPDRPSRRESRLEALLAAEPVSKESGSSSELSADKTPQVRLGAAVELDELYELGLFRRP